MKIATVHGSTFGEIAVGQCFKVKNIVYHKLSFAVSYIIFLNYVKNLKITDKF